MSFLRRVLHLPSKPTVSKLHFRPSPPPPPPHSSSPSSSSSSSSSNEQTPNPQPPSLTAEELSKFNNLIPRLCHHPDHHLNLPTAIRLTATALLTDAPLHSLQLSPLIQSLTSHPDTSPTFSLLTRLLHAPQSHHHISPIALLLLRSYFHNQNCKHALAVFRWLRRPDSPCPPGEEVYRVVIEGFCRNGFVLEGLVAMREIVGHEKKKLVPCCGSREWVYRGLLREAKVEDAVELNDALLRFESGGCGDDQGRERVLKLLERVIARWDQ